MKDKLKRKLQAKQIKENQSMFLLPPAEQPERKEYEMPDEYKAELEELEQYFERREQYNLIIPNLPPDAQKEVRAKLIQIDRVIETLEQQLADEYEQYQEEKRREEIVSTAIDKGMEHFEVLYIIAKHKIPKLYEKFKKIVAEQFPPDEIEDFYDRIAVREATELDELLREN